MVRRMYVRTDEFLILAEMGEASRTFSGWCWGKGEKYLVWKNLRKKN